MITDQIPRNFIEAAIEESIEIAERAPEKYQQSVFQVVLEISLVRPRGPKTNQPSEANQNSPTMAKVDEREDVDRDILQEKFDWSGTKIAQLKGLAQYLGIIDVALNEFKIDGLSAKKVQEVLFEKFRISKTPNTVSMTLMDSVGKYVDRIKEKGEYLYRITMNGIEFLRQEEAKI